MNDDGATEVTVPEGVGAVRLDQFALEHLAVLPSRQAARKAVKRGLLLVDGAPARSGDFVRPGQRLALLPGAHPHAVYPLAVPVLYEDDALAVLDKPAGLVVNGARRRTLENALPHNLAPSAAIDALPWPRPVHRLDAPTSGLVVVAKTASALVALSDAFRERRVEKRYRAIVLRRLEGEGICDAPVEGRPAVSRWRAVAHGPSRKVGSVTVVDLWPLTGRTHQLRVHLAALGHPILGDAEHGEDGLVYRGRGLFLAAVELTVPHPREGTVRIEIPEPHKFGAFLRREVERRAAQGP